MIMGSYRGVEVEVRTLPFWEANMKAGVASTERSTRRRESFSFFGTTGRPAPHSPPLYNTLNELSIIIVGGAVA